MYDSFNLDCDVYDNYLHLVNIRKFQILNPEGKVGAIFV